MLELFRKIRKQLLSQAQTEKYILYAVGEILLVVIGILLALQINNWNQNRKDRIQEQYYLENLQEEFNTNLEQLDDLVEFHKAQLQNAHLVLNVLTGDTIVNDIEGLHTSLVHVGWAPNRNITKDVWTELISSGNVGLIENNELRESISGFHSSTEYFNQVDKEWSYFNLKYRELTRGVLPPHLHVESGTALGFYKVLRGINSQLLSQEEISDNLNMINNIGGLIGDIIICRKVGLLISRRNLKKAEDTLKMIEKELKH